ncbi:MAG TPA: hypothetical protein PK907_07625 [Candidatus Sabulitectum sp.]|nr:hypothetical protein [Candidatus Sabulitectum sp.]
MRSLLLVLAAAAFTAAFADVTATCGWEGSDTILGSYGDIIASIDTDPVHGGSQSLKLVDDQASGTPQAFVAWVTGLSDGDVVTASFWRYDMTPSASPSCRIWGHWNDDPGDIEGYNGSAGGQEEYGPGTGWDMAEYSWTVVEGHTGLVIEARTYSEPGDTVWIDDLTVTAPDGCTIVVPSDAQSLDSETWAAIKATF